VRRSILQRVADIAIPWGVGLFVALVTLEEARPSLPAAGVAAGVALAVAQGAALHWRRSFPERVTAVALVGGLGTLLLAPGTVLPVAGFFALFSLAANRPPRVSLVGLAGLIALSAVNFFLTTAEDTWFTMAVAVGVWALGEAARNRRVAIQEAARRAVSEEQSRIARELHDVIAHSVSVIVVQAGAADDVFDERPDQARTALRSIEQAGRDALGELRRLLGAVRPDAGADPDAPQPRLDRLDELARPLRASGLEVAIRTEGDPGALPAGVELSAYRIVQEALTNTLRHARAGRAQVTLRYDQDSVEIDVRDDGRGMAAGDGDGGGHGIIGMRERAALVGGTLDAGPLERGGYRVHARLPIEVSP
jgi:signal transduction histidine kinase